MKRIAFYTRISLDEDKQKFSLDVQKERLEAFCKCQYGTKDWTLHRLYRETASGTTMQRPELQYMLAEAKAGLFDVVVVYRVDRFSRRVHELSILAMELKSYGVDFKSASEPIETDSPSGMMILQTLGVFAEFEQKSIVQRTKAGMLKKAQTGSWPGGTIPLGYRIDAEKKLHVVEEEAVIVRKMFSMYIEGQ
jgi:site-specific DNA recombinase